MEDSNLVIMTKAEAKPGKEKSVQQALRDVAKAARDTFLAGSDVKKFVTAVSGAFVESPQLASYTIMVED